MSDVEDQGEDPIRALVDRLRFNALERWNLPIDLDCAPDPLPSSLANDEEWQAAEALLSLSQERDRLREALSAPIQGITLGDRLEGKITEQEALDLVNASRLCLLAGARAALQKDIYLQSDDQKIMQRALRSAVKVNSKGSPS